MKLFAFRDFREGFDEAAHWIGTELNSAFRELRTGLQKLSFSDNFESFQVTLTIPATSQLPIRNQLKNGAIPSKWITVRRDGNGQNVCDGDTVWDKNYVYLKNSGGTPSTLTVVFLR